jgi:acyl-coenzyme A synthetase/AMP-(fatty) acid ligase
MTSWSLGLVCAAVVCGVAARAGAVPRCYGGSFPECNDLWWQCETCPQGINGECDGICGQASACSTGYYVNSRWTVRVGHTCNGTNPTRRLCKASTWYHNYYEYLVRIENQYWEQRYCYYGDGGVFNMQIGSSWESTRYCWIHDGYCVGNFGSGSLSSCRFDRLAGPPVCN